MTEEMFKTLLDAHRALSYGIGVIDMAGKSEMCDQQVETLFEIEDALTRYFCSKNAGTMVYRSGERHE